MRRHQINSMGIMLFIFTILLNLPGNFWQSNLDLNGGEESINTTLLNPTPAYQPPVPFDPNVHFQFNTSERAERQFPWSPFTTGGVALETPSSYNSTFVNMTVRVVNATWDNQTVIDYQAPGASANVLQAQGFNISKDTNLFGISIYIKTESSPSSNTLSIREGSPGGPILAQKTVPIPNVAGWLYIPLDAPLFLAPGHYYLQWPLVTGGSNKAQWMRTNTWTATQDCYVYSGGWTAQLFNLTLKIHLKNTVDPESVGMQVDGQPVLNLGNGLGWANKTSAIIGSSLSYTITNSSPIDYSYAANSTVFRSSQTINSVNLNNENANWTLTGFSYPGSSYSAYQGNITGFNENHTTVQAFLGQNIVGFSRPPPYDTLLFASGLDTIKFLSTNYITNVEAPTEMHSNQDLDLNVTVGDVGTVNITIYNGTGSVYNNGSDTSGTKSFSWHVNTTLTAGEYTFEATFFKFNQVGFFRQNFTLSKIAAIDTYNLAAIALAVLKLSFRLYDAYEGQNLVGAIVNYNFANLTGSLQYEIGNYTTEIDLGIFSILPGTYSLSLTAQKLGYQTVFVSMPVTIAPRPIDIEVADLASSVVLGGFVEVNVVALDLLSGGGLLRPVDFNITIYRSGGDPDVDAIASAILKSVISTATEILPIPTSAAVSTYDISIQVASDYYTGSKVLANALRIEEPPNIWIYVLIVVGVAVVAVGSYVIRQRALSKRSVRGAIVMNPGGMPIARKISPDFSTMNPHLIAGAVMGIVTMVKEMTGSSIRTIALEGRYLKIVLRDAFWFVLLTQRNPSWISGAVRKCVDDIQQRYGTAIAAWKGEGNIQISLDLTLKRWFGIEINETREPELEMASGVNQAPNEKSKQDSPQPSLPPPSH